MSSPPPAVPAAPVRRQTPTCLSLAAWCAVQEAAKQCVAARLRTHHGGPAQTLAALEHALQAAVGRLQLEQQPASAVLEHPQGGSTSGDTAAPLQQQQQLQAAVLLLFFLYALEQGIASASDGCTARAAAPQTSAAFFAANKKASGGGPQCGMCMACTSHGMRAGRMISRFRTQAVLTLVQLSRSTVVHATSDHCCAAMCAGVSRLVRPLAPNSGARGSCCAAA